MCIGVCYIQRWWSVNKTDAQCKEHTYIYKYVLYVYVYICIYINWFSHKEKQLFGNLKFHAVLSTIFSHISIFNVYVVKY